MKAHQKLTVIGVGRVLRPVAVAALFWLAAADLASACPSCKEALGSSGSGGDLVSGFFWSILFMLSMPFLLLGSFSLYFYYLIRKARPTPQT